MRPEPTSAAAARRLLRDALHDANRLEWLDAGELAISEIVTNAALHAHTDIELRVDVYDDEVCIQVEDGNPALPIRRDYDDEATTGRGLDLVALLSRACGVESLGVGGKVVWACVGDGEDGEVASDPDALLDLWADDVALATLPSFGSVPVLLRSMPINLWLSAREHHDAILRELVLYLAEHPTTTVDIRSADEARVLISCALLRELEGMHGVGHPSRLPWVVKEIDLALSVPADTASCFGVLQDVLDLAESLAVRGDLFTRPALPEIVAVRDWACEQVIAQVVGAPSAPELVGRRVVTLVPPRFREAHVAGFSRFLSSGEARILGMPLDLPLLAKDGSEIMCRFRIELGPATTGRTVYLAWIEP